MNYEIICYEVVWIECGEKEGSQTLNTEERALSFARSLKGCSEVRIIRHCELVGWND